MRMRMRMRGNGISRWRCEKSIRRYDRRSNVCRCLRKSRDGGRRGQMYNTNDTVEETSLRELVDKSIDLPTTAQRSCGCKACRLACDRADAARWSSSGGRHSITVEE